MATLGNLIEQVRGVSYKPEDLYNTLNENSVVLLRANNIKDGELNFDDVVYVDRKKVADKQFLKAGDILICASSGSKELVGKAAYVNCDLPMTFGAFCKVIRPKTECPKYIGHFFNSPFYRERIANSAAGANINNIRNEHIDMLEIVWPSLENQIKVTVVLDKVTELIALRKEQLAKLDQLVKSRFIELFDNEEYEKVTVSSVLNTGFWLMPATPEFIVDGEVPYITSKNIKSRTIDFDNVKYISREAYQSISANRPTQKGDILVSMIGTLGQTAVIQDDREFYGQNLYLLRLNSSIIDTTYFCEFFNSDVAQHELQSKRNQSTQAYLKANHVEDLVLPLPPMELQQQFATFVEQTNKLKLAVQQSLDKLETLKKSLMQEYFR